MDMKDVPEHGDRVKDSITGYTGIVIGITDWLFGCKHVAVKKEGLDKKTKKPHESKSFDIQRVEVIDKGAVPLKACARKPDAAQCGDKVKCYITGFEGIIVGLTIWDSEVAVYIQPQSVVAEGDDLGMPSPEAAIVESQVQVLERGVVKRPSLERYGELEAAASGRDRVAEDKAHPGGPADELPQVIR